MIKTINNHLVSIVINLWIHPLSRQWGLLFLRAAQANTIWISLDFHEIIMNFRIFFLSKLYIASIIWWNIRLN